MSNNDRYGSRVFRPRKHLWLLAALLLASGLTRAEPTVNPNGKVELTPELSRKIGMRALDWALRKDANNVPYVSCLLSIWFAGDGTIQGAERIANSGYPRIDDECLSVVIGEKLKVPTSTKPELGGWTRLPITWVFNRLTIGDDRPPVEPDPAIPQLRARGPLHVLPADYPAAALAQHAQGRCLLHVAVTARGEVDSVEVTQSTGSPDLDGACVSAIRTSGFVPAMHDGQPVAGQTDVLLDWRLPPPSADSR